MNRNEYERMAAVEGEHWWYRGLRDGICRAVRQFGGGFSSRPRILDAGCGTGANLQLLETLLQPAYLGGFDISPIALAIAATKAPTADLYCADICDPEVRAESLDLVLCCDVIYTPGLEASRPGLQRLVDRLTPGGLLVLNVPAYNWLYSDHDRAVNTRERFTARQIRRLLHELGLVVNLLTYRLCPLFPLVVLSRLPSIVRPNPRPEAVESAIDLPPRIANAILTQILTLENAAVQRGLRSPWGSSIFAVGRKPTDTTK